MSDTGDMTARMAYKAQISARVFRGVGTSFKDPVTGKAAICPGGEWIGGREGKWYDHGTIAEAVVARPTRRNWFMLRVRMALNRFFNDRFGGPNEYRPQ